MPVPGYQTRIAYGDAATFADSNSWSEFADVIELTPPNMEADDIESSNMTTSQQIKTFLPGWADPGEIEMTLEFEKAKVATLYGLFRIPKGFRIEFNDAPSPSGSKLYADGYIKSLGNEADREGLTTCKIVVKVSGAVEFEEAGEGE